VKLQLRILTGALAGHTAVFSKPSISLGRADDADLRFDRETDLDASARHAALLKKGDKWFVRDQGSKNGTFVNGHRIKADVRLDDTDQIQLGSNGPTIEIRLVPDATADGVVQSAPERPRTPQAPVRPTSASSSRPSTTQRIRIEVGKQTRKHKMVIGVLAAALLAVAGGFIAQNRLQERRRTAEIAALRAETDSVIAASEQALQALQGEVEGLAARLRSSRSDVDRLQGELAAALRSGDANLAASLRTQLDAASQSLGFQQAAAQVDYRGIVDRNQRAVALVWVEFGPREVYSGTAFAVRSDGVLITNRHVVAGESGTRRPTRIAVRFADSDQTWRGRVLTSSQDVDLAVIKVDVRGGVPTIQGLNARPDTLHQGDPVAVIGFPLGTELPMSGDVVRTSFTAGSVSKNLPDVLQIDGYGAEGASGSPIFDRRGQVIGVLYGGRAESGGRVVFGVPSQHVARLLQAIP